MDDKIKRTEKMYDRAKTSQEINNTDTKYFKQKDKSFHNINESKEIQSVQKRGIIDVFV